MDYSQLLEALNKADLFDLYRLKTALNNELDNPERLELVKKHLQPGMHISYFDAAENRLIECQIEEVRRTRALVRNLDDGKKWTIPFYMFNLRGVATEIHPASNRASLNKNQIQIGDYLGFFDSRLNREVYGKAVKLNPKTVTLMEDGPQGKVRWRVSYSLLFKVIEGDSGQTYLPR